MVWVGAAVRALSLRSRTLKEDRDKVELWIQEKTGAERSEDLIRVERSDAASFCQCRAMAKNPKRRRKFRKYLKGIIDEIMGLSTLAAETLISALVGDSIDEKAWLTSVVATWSLSDMTTGDNIGPIVVGVAHSDYTSAEVEAWIENTNSWTEGDLVSREVAQRKIRLVGTFEAQVSGSGAIVVLNDGKPIHTKCGWQLTTGDTVRFWAYNSGTAALATTSPEVRMQGHANLWPN